MTEMIIQQSDEERRKRAVANVYGQVTNPLEFVDKIGKYFCQSQIMGVSSPGDGAVLALTCLVEGVTPLEFIRTYHIIQGRPSMRADAMHAKFRAAGGRVKWINSGEDGKEARAVFSYDGQDIELAFTVEDAKRLVGDKFSKPDSNYQKDLPAMLRARLITKAVRMIAPELVAGTYTPEEIADLSPPQKADPSADDLAARREELAALSEVAEPAPITQDEVIDVVAETPAQEPSATPAPTSASPSDQSAPVEPSQLQELAALGNVLGMDLATTAKSICDNFKIDQVTDMTKAQAEESIARFKKSISMLEQTKLGQTKANPTQ